jgi:EAL domain-containing protein (putative c-di-GMP-specific phosphodiesterase class I)
MAIDERHRRRPGASSELSRASLADIAHELSGSAVDGVQKILNAVRSHLNMDVAFVSEFVGKERYFRHVDAKGPSPLKAGDSMPLADGYCQRVVNGLLPELIVDTADVPEAMALPDTLAIPIGSHLSVPIRLKSGHVYGTFCCFNFATDPTLNERDLHFMRAFADVAAFQIDRELEHAASRTEKSARIAAALERRQPSMVYQPVVSLDPMKIVGIECLARFELNPFRAPDLWFAEAAEVGQGLALELQAIRNGLDGLRDRDLPADLCIWLNMSATTVMTCALQEHFQGFAPGRLVLELTEHDHVADYAALDRALRPLRAMGVCIAIDDAGAGYSSMSHILNIAPDHIKLDLSLTRHIDIDRKRRALAAALIEFGKQTDCKIVAEGVESASELDALRALGVQMAQGFFICEPVVAASLPDLLARFGSDAPATEA